MDKQDKTKVNHKKEQQQHNTILLTNAAKMQLLSLILSLTLVTLAMSSGQSGIPAKEIPTCRDKCTKGQHCLIDKDTQEHVCLASTQ